MRYCLSIMLKRKLCVEDFLIDYCVCVYICGSFRVAIELKLYWILKVYFI